MKKIISLLFISALFVALTGVANATIIVPSDDPIKGKVVTGVTYQGNDNGGVTEIDGNLVTYLGTTAGNADGSVTNLGTDGEWTYTGTGTVEYIAIKAGHYVIYIDVPDGSTGGTWSTYWLDPDVRNPQGIPPGLSHIIFYGSTSNVPAPAAVWLLGTGLAGIFGIRRKMKK